MPKGDGKMHDEAAVTMLLESNLKHSQLRTINRHFKHTSRVNFMCKEEDVRKSINSLSITKFQ